MSVLISVVFFMVVERKIMGVIQTKKESSVISSIVGSIDFLA